MAQDRERNAALKAKEKGNALFKDGQLAESVKAFKEAEKLDPSNPIYASNLSAALYELGDYVSGMNAVLRSWSSIKSRNDQSDAPLSLKLSTRLAKCLSQGVQDGKISASLVEQNAEAIKELEGLSTKEKEGSEAAQAWKMWRTIRPGLQHQRELSHEANVRLSKMPMFKEKPDPYDTYFVFGTDPIISLVSDWGSEDHADDPINLRSLTKEQISQLSFLIAGPADGRHGFGTIIGLAEAYNKLGPAQKKDMRAHVTLLDITPAVIARHLVLFMLIDQLLAEDRDPQERLVIQATLVYVYMGWIIPSYCHDRLLSICADLKDRLQTSPPRLPSWFHIDRNSIKPILPAIDFWLTNTTLTPTRLLSGMSHRSGASNIQSMLESDYPGIRENVAARRRDAEKSLKTMPDEVLVNFARSLSWPGAATASVKTLRKMLNKEKFREKVVNFLVMADFDKNILLGMMFEEEWYQDVQVFVPPAALLDRHPGFDAFARSRRAASEEGEVDEAKFKLEFKKLKRTVLKEWKANVTLLDGTSDEPLDVSIDAFTLAQATGAFNRKHSITDKDPRAAEEWPAYSYTATFFDAVVAAIKVIGDKLKVELVCGEVNHELAKIRLGTDSRPPEFPKKFTRIWLSNIPDYTHGTLSTAMCVLPLLQDKMDSAVTSNCMFNSPVWKSDDEFCYNYTLLLPKDLERYLGFRTLRSQAVQTFLTLAPNPLPRPLSALASREKLHSWLARLLLSLVSPGTSQARPNFVKLPNNLVAFVQLLVELRNIGYPSHWLSDFVHAVLGGTLVVDHLTYKGSIPRPVSELREKSAPHRVRLDPWYAELETILVSTRHGLPFAVQIPAGASSGAKTAEEIGMYKATPVPGMLFDSPIFKLPPYDNVVCLLFYNKTTASSERSVNELVRDLPHIVDGREHPARGTFHVMTSVEFVDLKKPEVRWRMSKSLVAKMKREGWSVAVWRIDMWISITSPCPATSWRAVEAPI